MTDEQKLKATIRFADVISSTPRELRVSPSFSINPETGSVTLFRSRRKVNFFFSEPWDPWSNSGHALELAENLFPGFSINRRPGYYQLCGYLTNDREPRFIEEADMKQNFSIRTTGPECSYICIDGLLYSPNHEEPSVTCSLDSYGSLYIHNVSERFLDSLDRTIAHIRRERERKDGSTK